MSAYLSDKLKQYTKKQSVWKLEMPCYLQGVLIGYRLMNTENVRRLFCGAELKPDAKPDEVPLPLDLLSICKEHGLTMLVAVNERWWEMDCKQIRWGSPYIIRGIAFAYVKLKEVGAIELWKKEPEAVQ